MTTREKLHEARSSLAFVQTTIDGEVVAGREPSAQLLTEKRRVRAIVAWYEKQLHDEEARAARGGP